MNIERTEFIAWMERIMERFDILKEQVSSNQSRFIEIDGEVLLDNQDVLQLLKISSRSLQRYRTDKKLPYYTISGKLYYKLSDVHQLIRECLSSKRTIKGVYLINLMFFVLYLCNSKGTRGELPKQMYLLPFDFFSRWRSSKQTGIQTANF